MVHEYLLQSMPFPFAGFMLKMAGQPL